MDINFIDYLEVISNIYNDINKGLLSLNDRDVVNNIYVNALSIISFSELYLFPKHITKHLSNKTNYKIKEQILNTYQSIDTNNLNKDKVQNINPTNNNNYNRNVPIYNIYQSIELNKQYYEKVFNKKPTKDNYNRKDKLQNTYQSIDTNNLNKDKVQNNLNNIYTNNNMPSNVNDINWSGQLDDYSYHAYTNNKRDRDISKYPPPNAGKEYYDQQYLEASMKPNIGKIRNFPNLSYVTARIHHIQKIKNLTHKHICNAIYNGRDQIGHGWNDLLEVIKYMHVGYTMGDNVPYISIGQTYSAGIELIKLLRPIRKQK